MGGGGSRGGMGGGMGGGRGMGGGGRGGMGGPPRGGGPYGPPPPPRREPPRRGYRRGGSSAGSFLGGMLVGGAMGSASARRSGGGQATPPPQNNDDNGQGGGGGGGSDRSGCIIAVVAVILIIIVIALFAGLSGGGCSSSSVTASTVNREKLDSSAVNETNYYTDDGGWGLTDTVDTGMRSFYKETGVQPYLYLLADGYSYDEMETMAGDLYDELFTDEGHFLLLISDDGSGYAYQYSDAVGSQAKTVMDNEAIEIVLDYIDEYYDDTNKSWNDIFSTAFDKAGSRIMTKTTRPIDLVVPIIICIVIVIVAIVVFITLRRRREQRERESQRVEEILKTPLEKYGDQDTDNLAEEYEDEAASGKSTKEATAKPAEATTQASEADAVENPEKEYGDKDVEDLAEKYEEQDGASQTGDE